MKILIPPSEGKAKVQPLDILFKDNKGFANKEIFPPFEYDLIPNK